MPDIYFYHTGQDWDIFSNVSGMLPIEVVIEDHHYTSSSTEGVYQALKDIHHNSGIMLLPAGGSQQQAGHKILNTLFMSDKIYVDTMDHGVYTDGTPLTIKERLMYDLLKIKATQHPEVMKALLSTGSSQIIENTSLASYDDSFWGNGKRGTGKNALGKLWMMLRDEINSDLIQQHSVPVMVGLSHGVTVALGIRPSAIVIEPNKCINQSMLSSIQLYTTTQNIELYRHTWFNHSQHYCSTLAGDIDTLLTPPPQIQSSTNQIPGALYASVTYLTYNGFSLGYLGYTTYEQTAQLRFINIQAFLDCAYMSGLTCLPICPPQTLCDGSYIVTYRNI